MSVINQVLNQLERRGASIAAGPVRTVHEVRAPRAFRIVLIVMGILLATSAVFIWRTLPIVPSVVAPPKIAAASAVVIVAADEERAVMPASTMVPTPLASRLSFELSSVPLPRIVQPESRVTPEVPPALPASTVQAMPVHAFSSPPIKQVSSAQQADAEFRKAAAFMQQGRTREALSGYEAALRIDAGYDAARQALVALLLEGKRGGEAEQVLQEGLKNKPAHSGFAMLLARFQVERGDLDQAVVTLENTLPHVGQQAEYQAFYAALLQRKNRHQDAAEHYQAALKLTPNNGVWLMGYGISLQALARLADAKSAYQRALDSQTLTPELQAFVQQKLKGL